MTSNNDSDDLKAFSTIVEVLKPLDRSNQIRLLQTVSQFLGLESFMMPAVRALPTAVASQSTPPEGPYSTDRSSSPKQFLLEKQPKTDVERVACLAYYMTHFRDTPHFRTLDISKLNTEAAQPKFANAANAVDNATKMGYLVQATKGNKQLSAAGEHFVQFLPDRDAARASLSNLLRRKAFRRRSKRESPSTN